MLVARGAPPRGQLRAPFIRRFCQSATIRVCELSGEQAEAYLSGEDLTGWADGWADGARIVKVDGQVMGRGRKRADVLACELPKELRIRPVGG
ncbi:MAG: NOL1/NOP2/fmu family ribosome biogenesis protein [Bradymonadia bacterium]|jgi:NOL1/NOP2/fmu family ribosome biogenesis protein